MKKEIKEDVEIEKTNFEGLEFEVLEMEKKCLISKEPNFLFKQATNSNNFSDKDDWESQDIENGSRS